jgi:hypothetical protein
MLYRYPFIVLVLALIPQQAVSQHPHSEPRQVEVGIGLATPFLQSGSELDRAREIRASGHSYFRRADGSRRDVGSYPRLVGFSAHPPRIRLSGVAGRARAGHFTPPP